MSIAEAGVLFGVLLEGTEYIPPIRKRWPALEKIGFLVLVISLAADWRFQSAINEQQTDDLIKAEQRLENERQARATIEQYLHPRFPKQKQTEEIAARLKPFEGQKIDVSWYPKDQEANLFGGIMADVLRGWCGWKVNIVRLDVGQYGSMIAYDPKNPQAEKAAKALFAAMTDVLHIDVGGPDGPTMSNPPTDGKVLFLIGTLYGSKHLPSWRTPE
jgi:hypothetical protein